MLEQLETDDAFLKTGVQLITSTSDPERVHELLAPRWTVSESATPPPIKFFSDMAGYSPTFGILGTVIGLIGVLGQLQQPGQARPGHRGRVHRHAVGRPARQRRLAPDLQQAPTRSEEEVAYREMVTEGLLTMQLNVSSMDLRDRLYASSRLSERNKSCGPVAPDALVAVEAA